jgi:hypothetical protein
MITFNKDTNFGAVASFYDVLLSPSERARWTEGFLARLSWQHRCSKLEQIPAVSAVDFIALNPVTSQSEGSND